MSQLFRTPLYSAHQAQQARLVAFAGWEMPLYYATITEEHQAVRQRAGRFDISHMGRLFFRGSGAASLLEWVYTNSVATLKTEQVRYGLICNEAGGIKDDVLLYRLPEISSVGTAIESARDNPLSEDFSYLLVVNAANREKIHAWLETHRSDREVEIRDATFATAMMAVQGPGAVSLCQRLTETPLLDLRYYHCRYAIYRGQRCLVSRTGYTGEDGLEWVMPLACAVPLWEDLHKLGITACGLGARDTLRLEAAMPLYGHELTEEIDPVQAGLEWAVKWQEKDFLGRAALVRRREDGNLPRRVGLELAGRRIAREQCRVWRGEQAIGWISSGTFAPTLQKSIALAYVAPGYTAVGTALEVEIRNQREAAQVVALPFYARRRAAR